MPDSTEIQKKAFDFAADLTKQLIGLSTSVITVTLLFGKDLPRHSHLAFTAWLFFLVSTLCGLWTLMALTGTLAPRAITHTDQTVEVVPGSYELVLNVRLPSALQIGFFALAIVFTLLFVCGWY